MTSSSSPALPNPPATSFNTSFSNCSVAVPISDELLANAANIPEEQYFTRHPYKEKCDYCDKEFETPASFHVHHPCFERSEFFLKNQGHDDPNGLHYLCKFCNRRFFERHLLKQHIRYHLPDRPFECNFCGHRFVCRPEVVAHVSSFHLKLKPFMCKEPGCGKKYAEKFSLERHMDKNHGGKAFYRCKVCGEEFHWNSKWNKHKKTHPNYPEDEVTQPMDGNPLVCSWPGCGKKYSQKFMVGLHYEAVHLGKPRYKCDVCDKTFMFGQYLRDHKKRVGHFTEGDQDIIDGVNFMEGEDMDLLEGEDGIEDMEDGMIEYFEQEIQEELKNKQHQGPFECKKNLAQLLAEGPSSSTGNYLNGSSLSLLEATLSKRNSKGQSLLESALGPPTMNQLSGSQSFQNTNYAISQQQQHQQQMSFASFQGDSSSIDDSSLGDYFPGNFLEVILIENDSPFPDSFLTSNAKIEITLESQNDNSDRQKTNKKDRAPQVTLEVEELIPGPDPSIPFTPKKILVCQVCEGRFLSQILFTKHTEDHPTWIEKDDRSDSLLEVLKPLKSSVIQNFSCKKNKSTAVVQPTIMTNVTVSEEPVLTDRKSVV